MLHRLAKHCTTNHPSSQSNVSSLGHTCGSRLSVCRHTLRRPALPGSAACALTTRVWVIARRVAASHQPPTHSAHASGLMSAQQCLQMQGQQQQQRLAGQQSCGQRLARVPFVAGRRPSRAAPQRVQATAAPEAPPSAAAPAPKVQRPDAAGRFGKYGGKYVPETLTPALAELETAYKQAMADPAFQVRDGGLWQQGSRWQAVEGHDNTPGMAPACLPGQLGCSTRPASCACGERPIQALAAAGSASAPGMTADAPSLLRARPAAG
jgi:hypothetical protein